MQTKAQESFSRLLKLLEEGDSEIVPSLLLEAQRRGELGKIVDIPINTMISLMEKSRERNDLEVSRSIADYARHLFRMWRALAITVDSWIEAQEKGNKLWGPVTRGGKWHQRRDPEGSRCGIFGEFLFEIPFIEISDPKVICKRCLSEAQKNWKTMDLLIKDKVEGCVLKKIASWYSFSDREILLSQETTLII